MKTRSTERKKPKTKKYTYTICFKSVPGMLDVHQTATMYYMSKLFQYLHTANIVLLKMESEKVVTTNIMSIRKG